MIYRNYGNRNSSDRKIGIWRVLRTIIIYAAITIIISIQIFRLGSVFRYWNNNRVEKELRIHEVAELEKKQEEMNKELNDLKNNVLTNERLARSMGYVKSGEIVYKFKSRSL